jgi:hypothetical protein
MFFSEELYNAEKFGYKFDIKWGYTFQRGNIFKAYVTDLYQLRLQYPKSDPMNFIAKIHLNSLYGRFGMKDMFDDIVIFEKDDHELFEKNNNISDLIDIGTHIIAKLKKPIEDIFNKEDYNNVNIAIASAVTSYARIHMSQFKNNPNFPNLYYTDTDSTYFDGPLPEYLVSSTELGKMKLEGIYDKALFLAPKLYALENIKSGESIIKIKGLTKEAIKRNNITIELLENLLHKDYKLTFKPNKWFKSLNKANIQILEQIYTIQTTDSKRELIYSNGKFINTKALQIEK